MQLGSLLKQINGTGMGNVPDVTVAGITSDSRQVCPGYVFAALRGMRDDGWQYVADAAERGAVAVISEHEDGILKSICYIRVPDAARALSEAAAAIHDYPSRQLQTIGITGTNGKTTAAYMLWNILRADGRFPGLLGTIEYRVGARAIPATRTTPDAAWMQRLLAEMVGAGCRSVVMEVSSHGIVQRRVDCIDFDAAVFTNLTHDHLDYHGSMDGYFEAKSRLFSMLGGGGKRAHAVICIDGPWGQKLAQRAWDASTVTYGLSDAADVRANSLQVNRSGSEFMLHTPWGESRLHLQLLGRFNVANALGSIACAGALGIALPTVVEALSGIRSVPGRLEQVATGRDFQVFVDYAHTDDALDHVLRTLREITTGRLIVVFGCGGDRDCAKRPAMGRVAGQLADHVIVTSDNPRSEPPMSIIDEILTGLGTDVQYEVIEERAAAIQRAVEMGEEGDTVLVAGKGHEHFQEFRNTTVSFDDREMVKRFLK